MSICKYAYQGESSVCTHEKITPDVEFPIPTQNLCQKFDNPLCSMNSTYHTVNKQGPYEVPSRGDEVRFLMVEKCSGDMQGLLQENVIDDQQLYLMLCMVFHSLFLFDKHLGSYSHKDLGLRNILYTWDLEGRSDEYWRYKFLDMEIDIPTTTLIPKIWDFAYVRFADAHKYSHYYNYLPENKIPDFSDVEERDNDVYVILNDVQTFMKRQDSNFCS